MAKVLQKFSKILYPLWILSQLKSTVSSQLFLDFCKNYVLEQNWLKNQTSLISKRFLGFVHLFEWIPFKLEKFPKYMIIVLYIHFNLKR